MAHFVVFTDLDGCLLDSVTYTYEPAAPALEALRAKAFPWSWSPAKLGRRLSRCGSSWIIMTHL